MTIDRETPNAPASGTPKMSVIQGGKTKPPKGGRGSTDRVTGLTDRQEIFCQGIMAGLTYSDAYRQAYTTQGQLDATVWNNACKMAADTKVIARLEALRAQKEAERRMQALSLSQFVVDGWKQLAQPKITYADGTVEEIPPAVRTRNLELIGRHLGMFVERVETKDTTDRSRKKSRHRSKHGSASPETAGGAEKKGGGYTAPPKWQGWGCSGPLSASESVSRSRWSDRVPVQGAVRG
jgi:hypothetical protein